VVINHHKFKYYKQQTEYTCGPASVKMVLSYFGINVSELKILKIMNTKQKSGTKNLEFPKIFEKYKLNYVVMRNAKLDDLKTYLLRKYMVIVSYVYYDEDWHTEIGHYSVLRKIDSNYVYLYDPYFGLAHKIQLREFFKVWRNSSFGDNEKRWFIAVKK